MIGRLIFLMIFEIYAKIFQIGHLVFFLNHVHRLGIKFFQWYNLDWYP